MFSETSKYCLEYPFQGTDSFTPLLGDYPFRIKLVKTSNSESRESNALIIMSFATGLIIYDKAM